MLTKIKIFIKRTPWGKNYLQKRFDRKAFVFYGQFIMPKDVVIDVGANRGNRAKTFLKLGAFTVMVEPQTACIAHLKMMFRRKSNWVLIEAALGSEEGETEMLVNSDDTLSTLSKGWVDAVKDTGRFGDRSWDRRQKTRITTLDQIIKKHGVPAFIKIDVEGYEKEVLFGLSIPPNALSFEFTPEYIANAFECIDRISSMAEFEFQVSLYESLAYESDRWLASSEIKDYILSNKNIFGEGIVCFGDIYARRKK